MWSSLHNRAINMIDQNKFGGICNRKFTSQTGWSKHSSELYVFNIWLVLACYLYDDLLFGIYYRFKYISCNLLYLHLQMQSRTTVIMMDTNNYIFYSRDQPAVSILWLGFPKKPRKIRIRIRMFPGSGLGRGHWILRVHHWQGSGIRII